MSLFCPECHASYADESMGVCPRDGVRLYLVDDADPLIGAVIDDRFRIDYALGVGGMGTVYGGVQLSVNRDVAIKVLRAELNGREVALERFFREARTISKLSHPNIVKLIDFGQDRERDILYLAMELVRGQNLADLLSRGRLRTPLALEIAYQVCGALTEPHDDQVIHRDLKPDNLLLVPVSDGSVQAKVLDFGIARFMESNTQLTGTGMICGTPAYMAPEQAQNETLDPRTDLYALGIVLYEMLSGWPPFSGTSSLQVMLKHIQESPPQLRDLLPPSTLPEEIEDLVYSLMSKERSARPTSAREVRDAIDGLRDRFGLERVQLDSRDESAFDPFILPKLPRADRERSGPTQVLRRETGLEPKIDAGDDALTNVVARSDDTHADPVVGVTGPLTPDQKLEVAADALRLRHETREGGQQGWTPDGQAAVRAIKDTKDVDAYGATIDGASSEHATPRRTFVEADDSSPIVGDVPQTGDSIAEVAPELPSTRTPTVETTSESGGRSRRQAGLLTFVAIGVGAASIGAAIFVGQKLDQVLSEQTASPTPTPTSTAAAIPDEPPPPPETMNTTELAWSFARAQANVQVATRDATRAASNAKPAPDAKPRPAGNEIQPPALSTGASLNDEAGSKAANQKKKEEKAEPNLDGKIKNLLRDDLL